MCYFDKSLESDLSMCQSLIVMVRREESSVKYWKMSSNIAHTYLFLGPFFI